METYKEIYTGRKNISDIHTGDNIRKQADETALKELANNIKRCGVLEPVICREDDNGDLQLVAGHRRIAAAKLAGLITIPCRVLDISADEALELKAFENLHREQLSVMDEARAFKLLLDRGSYTVLDLAERVDKSTAYVYRSVRLTELPEEIQAALDEGKITPSHAHVILSLRKEDWAKATKELMEYTSVTAAAFRGNMNYSFGEGLANEYFPLDVPYAGAGPCSMCEKNTGVDTMLFGADDSSRCLDRECLKMKRAEYISQSYKKCVDLHKNENREFLGTANVTSVWRRSGEYIDVAESKEVNDKGNKIKVTRLVISDRATVNRKIKSALATNPEKFAYQVDDKTGHEILVCKDEALFNEAFPGRESGPAGEPIDWEKENFIRAAVREKLILALLNKKGSILAEVWRKSLKKENLPLSEGVINSLSKDSLLKLAYYCLVLCHCIVADWKAVGIDYDMIKQAAEAQAEKDWEKKQADEAKTKKQKDKPEWLERLDAAQEAEKEGCEEALAEEKARIR